MKQVKYLKLLEQIQQLVSQNYWQLGAEGNTDKAKQIILNFYQSYLDREQISVDGLSTDKLAQKIYHDTHEYSVLTDPLNNPAVEGIHINAWDCIILQMRSGEFVFIDGFETPGHAIDIMRRLVQSKGGVLDESMPIAETSIGSDIRITTAKTPIVDDTVGVSCYIRKLSKSVFSVEQYLQTDFATKQELSMLTTFMRRGVSLLVVGKVNTGKTTFLSYLLSTLPNHMKIVTIENAAREMDLVKKKDGKTINNVVHMLTRESKIKDLDIKQEDLVVISLRLNPDYISIAEMRDAEASAAVEASRSGHPVISTTHAGSPIEAHKRIADLSRKGNLTDYPTALIQAQEAFPVVVFLHALEDNVRRVMGVTECIVDDDNKVQYNPLWKYEIAENKVQDGNISINGKHKQVGTPSKRLLEKMKMYGISADEIKQLEVM